MFGGETGFVPQEVINNDTDKVEKVIEKNEGLSAELTVMLENKIKRALTLTNPDLELRGKTLPELIDMLIEENEKNYRAATYDALTELLKMEPFTERVKKNISKESENIERRKKGGAIIFIDLNGMKKMNDELGYLGTNDVIKEFSRRLEAKRSHDMVMRFGGDEFVMYMHGADPDQIGHSVMKRILSSLENNPIVVENESGQKVKVDVTFAMGVESIPGDLSSVEDYDQLARDLIGLASQQEKDAKIKSGHAKSVLSFVSSNNVQITKDESELRGNGTK